MGRRVTNQAPYQLTDCVLWGTLQYRAHDPQVQFARVNVRLQATGSTVQRLEGGFCINHNQVADLVVVQSLTLLRLRTTV